MSDDIDNAIENIDNADELDEETRDKLKQALADSEGDEPEDDDPDETRVDPNPIGAQVDADDESSEDEGDEDDEASADEGDEGDEADEASADEEASPSDSLADLDPAELDDEQREKLKQMLDESDDGDDEEADEASTDSAEDESDEAEEVSADSDEETDGQETDDEETEDVAAESADDDGTDAEATGFAAAGSDSDAIGGIFKPGSIGGESDDGDLDSAYLGAEDIEGYDEGEKNPTVFIMGAFVVLLMVGFSWVLLNYTEQGERMKHLFQGDLKAYEAAKASQIEETFEKEQLAKMPKYGNLTLNGRPKYASIILDGRLQYGKIPETGEWRPVLLTPTTQFQNLNVAEKHDVKVKAPNHDPKDWTLTEEMWTPAGERNMNFKKKLTINLLPESSAKQIEFQQRLEKDPENNYFGEVTITSNPEGAKIIFDGKPLLDEEGNQRTTPVTFEKAYWKNEESGEIEEQKVKVDMPPDRGHKIQLRMTDEKLDVGGSGDGKKGDKGNKGDNGGGKDKGGTADKVAKKKVGDAKEGGGEMTEIKDYGPDEYPKFVTPLQRQMWTCEWKDGEVPEEPPYPKHCNYSYELNVDFNKLKDFIKHKKKQRDEVKERNDELKQKLKELKEKLAAQ